MLTIYTYGASELRQKTVSIEDINGETSLLIDQMFEAMKMGRGIGLAAPQVGSILKLFICHISNDEPRLFINPEIVETSLEELSYEEGCLSLPGLYDEIIRPRLVTIQALTINGKPFTLKADGLLSRVIQHEMDHLNGVLFPDRLPEKRRERLLSLYEKKLRI